MLVLLISFLINKCKKSKCVRTHPSPFSCQNKVTQDSQDYNDLNINNINNNNNNNINENNDNNNKQTQITVGKFLLIAIVFSIKCFIFVMPLQISCIIIYDLTKEQSKYNLFLLFVFVFMLSFFFIYRPSFCGCFFFRYTNNFFFSTVRHRLRVYFMC